MMYLVFTSSDQLLSRLIRWVTGECVSHVALQVGEIAVHSTAGGVRMESMRKFLRKRKIIFRLPLMPNYLRLIQLYEKHRRSGYDWSALLYLGLRTMLPRLVPKQNLWQSTGMFMCTEWVTKYLVGKEDSLITPYKLYLLLKDKKLI